jgi:hypothetical protein
MLEIVLGVEQLFVGQSKAGDKLAVALSQPCFAEFWESPASEPRCPIRVSCNLFILGEQSGEQKLPNETRFTHFRASGPTVST